MDKAHNYLAIDLGAESGRLIVGSIGDDRLAIEETHRFPNHAVTLPDGLYWDILRLWSDIKTGIAISSQKFSKKISSIALDTWGVDFALLGQQDLLLANPTHYRDLRTDGILEEAFKRIPRETIYESTGIQFMQINTLYQLFSMVLSKSPILQMAEHFLTIPDLFNFWLCGSKQNEFTIATTTQCLNPLTGDWAYGLLEQLGIPTHIFSEIIRPGAELGTLRTSLAEEIDLDRIPIVAGACHDTGSAVVAIPAENDKFAWISSGTWSIMGVISPKPVINADSLACNFTNEGAVFDTWRLSKNIIGLWLVQECKREWGVSYDEITQMARESQAFKAVIDVDDELFLHHGDMPTKIRRYCAETHQAVPETRGEIVRVALESLALKYRLVLGQLENLIGDKLETIHIIGGGTKNKLLNQLAADATGRNIITGPVEATAIGNVVMQAIALGHLDTLDDARSLIRRSFEVTHYHPQPDSRWDDAYVRLLEGSKK
jgi:rhamnulokinase